MKILQIGTSLYDWGGIERYVAYLARGMTERDHEVDVACPPGTPLAERTAGRVRPMRLRFQFSFWLLPHFIRVFREGKYDVAHVHFSPDFVVPVLAARRAGIPRVVLTRHVALPWKAAKVRRYTGPVDRVVCVSEAVRSVLAESGVEPRKLVVAKAGCPSLTAGRAAAELRERLTEGGRRFAVGFFGRLVADKGVQHLAAAAATLPDTVQIHIFGDGPLRPELEASRSPAHFHGFVPDVADAMAAMDLIVVPSVWAEAFPFSVLEAMSLGKPIVATRRGGLPEMVDEGETGLLVPAEDPAALAEAIAELASDPDRAAAMGRRAQEVQRRDYTIEAFAERMEAVYASI